MKPITIIIPLLAMLCGCDEKSIEQLRMKEDAIRMQEEAKASREEWNGFVLKHKLNEIQNRLAKLESAQRIRDGLADVIDLCPEPTNKVWAWSITNVTLIYTTNINAIHLDRK